MNRFKKNAKLLILVGAPGSGKSSFAKYFLRTEENWIRVNRDDFRAMQFEGTKASERVEAVIGSAIFASVKALLEKGVNVIADATHCRKDYINEYINQFNTIADIEFKVFDVDKDELMRRCAQRAKATGKEIPEAVLDKILNDFKNLKAHFDFSPIPRKFLQVPQPKLITDKPNCYLVDLDGTVAQANGRTMYSPTNDEVFEDTPLLAATTVIKLLMKTENVIFCSGREESVREGTEKWINHYIATDGEKYQLVMRQLGDSRKDSIVKRELLNTVIRTQYNVVAVFDDRLQVVRECWNAEGVFCFNVNQFLEEF